MTTAETYVTAAYCAIFGIVLLYVVLIALKLRRLEREVERLADRRDEVVVREEREPAPVG
jgi:CcmD family protein